MKFSEKIKKLRKNNNLTQEEFAKQILVSPKVVSKWENDTAYPSVENLKTISKTFKVSYKRLMNHDDFENKNFLDEQKAKRCYWLSLSGFGLTILFLLLSIFLMNRLYIIGAICGVIIYLIFAYFAIPKYKRIARTKSDSKYLILRIVISVIVICVFVCVFFIK